jgi:hypothetical protein
MARYTPMIVARIMSPNFSSRQGAKPVLIVIHATVSHNRPGNADLVAIGNFFKNSSVQASSHVCTDNDGTSARYVNDRDKAWHCAAYNRMSLGIEQILPATGAEVTLNLYRETARWVARWSKKYGIPIRSGLTDNNRGTVLRSGVVRHSDLGAIGGGHSDPGPYDMAAMMKLALDYRKHI